MSHLCVCMRDVISEFNSEIEGSLAFCSLMLFLILCLMCSGSGFHVECILPFGMLCLSAWRMMFVKMVFAVCMSGGGRMSDKASSVCVVKCVQFAFLKFVNVCRFCCSLYLLRVLIVVIMGKWSELVRVLCARFCGCIVFWKLL